MRRKVGHGIAAAAKKVKGLPNRVKRAIKPKRMGNSGGFGR